MKFTSTPIIPTLASLAPTVYAVCYTSGLDGDQAGGRAGIRDFCNNSRFSGIYPPPSATAASVSTPEIAAMISSSRSSRLGQLRELGGMRRVCAQRDWR
ncbi:hypothetical protein DL95DRAFT_383964 [Leptodontidium sp. 2 PMI_412]|nr:hypothetical protein DL95DRAFT_383964 [Leptodontidium sp. 2 PMI_412]